MNKLLNIYEGFFGNVRADLSSEYVFKFIDNMSKNSNQLADAVSNKIDEVNYTFYPGFSTIACYLLSNIRYNGDYSEKYMNMLNASNISRDSIHTIGDLIVGIKDRCYSAPQIIITPETILYDESELPKWVSLKSTLNSSSRGEIACDVYIFGFKNLKNIDTIFDGMRYISVKNLFIFDCPKLDKVNINLKPYACGLVFFDPNKDKKFTYMEIKRMFKLGKVENLVFRHKNSEYKANEEPVPVKTSVKTSVKTTVKTSVKPTTIRNQSSTPSSPSTPNLNNAAAVPGDIKDLPILTTNNSYNVFTVDNMSTPVGRITRNGQKIYRINQANIWLTVQEIDGRKICFNKRGIPLYELK